MYGTSVGTFLSVILSLNYDWDIIDTYFINRPWQNIFKIDIYTILQAFEKRGVLGLMLWKNAGTITCGERYPN